MKELAKESEKEEKEGGEGGDNQRVTSSNSAQMVASSISKDTAMSEDPASSALDGTGDEKSDYFTPPSSPGPPSPPANSYPTTPEKESNVGVATRFELGDARKSEPEVSQ